MSSFFTKIAKSFFQNGPVFIIIAAIMWSVGGIVRAQIQDYKNFEMFISPVPLVFWEHFFGLLVLLPFIIWKRNDFAKMNKKDWFAAALIGFLASTMGTIFFVSGLSLVWFAPLSIVVLMQQLQPITAIISAKILLKEKLPPQFLAYILMAMVGVYFMTFPNPFKPVDIENLNNNLNLFAALFGLLASICWGFGTTLGRYFLKHISFLTGTSLRFFFGTIFSGIILIIIFATKAPTGLETIWGTAGTQLNSGQLQLMLTGILITGVGAMLVYYYGLKRTQAKVATIAELAWPVTTFLYDIFTGKTFSVLQIVGALIVVISMSLVGKTNQEISNDQK